MHPILLYDGVCGLCNRLVQFILKRDRDGAFRFAPLQSALAKNILSGHRSNPSELETLYVVKDFGQAGESLLARSDAVMFIFQELGGIWRIAAAIFRIVPPGLRNRVYGVVARNRYRVFGSYDACPLPNAETRSRFLDL